MQYIQDRYLFRRIRHELFENVFNNPEWSLRNLNVNASRKIYQRALDFHFLDSKSATASFTVEQTGVK